MKGCVLARKALEPDPRRAWLGQARKDYVVRVVGLVPKLPRLMVGILVASALQPALEHPNDSGPVERVGTQDARHRSGMKVPLTL